MMRNGFAKGFSLVGILQGRFIRPLSDAKGLGSNADSGVVKSVHGDREPVADAFDDVLNRDLAIVEDKRAGIG